MLIVTSTGRVHFYSVLSSPIDIDQLSPYGLKPLQDARDIIETARLMVHIRIFFFLTLLTLKYLIPRRVPYSKGRIRKLPYGTRDIP